MADLPERLREKAWKAKEDIYEMGFNSDNIYATLIRYGAECYAEGMEAERNRCLAIANKLSECNCHEAYKGRGLHEPNAGHIDYAEEIAWQIERGMAEKIRGEM